MTIDEAIVHAEEVASRSCDECANEHKQLAEWLKDYKRLKEQEHYYKGLAESYEKTINKLTKAIAEQEPKTAPCEEYKRGWHDAIVTALKETHNYYTEDGVFSAIQEESLIGVGMIQE